MTRSDVRMVDLLGFGHCCADYLVILHPFPEKGKKGDVVQSLTIGGGPVPTACQTIAAFGRTARFIGMVGDDSDGRLVLEGLRRWGVDDSQMMIDPNVTTARAYIWIDRSDGSRTVALDTTGFRFPEAEELNIGSLAECRMFLVDGRAGEATLKGLREARRLNIPTMLDAGASRPQMAQMLPLLDYAVVSCDFADTYAPGLTPEDLARRLIDDGAGMAVVTQGETGACWRSRAGGGFVRGFQIGGVIDTTGAGDIFHGGLIYALLEGRDIEHSIRFAGAAAALSTRRISGQMGIPTLEEVENVTSGG